MIANATSLIGTSGVTSALGFLYWALAARAFTPAAVGFASAILAAMTLLGTLSALGFGTLVVSELPRHRGQEGRLIATVLLVAGSIGVVLGILFAWMAPLVSADFVPFRASFANVLLFALGVGVAPVAVILDQALIGLMRGGLQLTRNIVFASVKLIALAAAGIWLRNRSGLTIYTTWTLGNLVSLTGLAAFLIVKRTPIHRYMPHWYLVYRLRRRALEHHALNLALKSPSLLIPLIIAWVLTTTANAYYAVAFAVAYFVFAVPQALSDVLYAVGAASLPSIFAKKMRFTLRVSLIASIAANVLLIIVGQDILRAFGHVYAEESIWPLRFLCLAVFPLIVKDHYVTICRVKDRVKGAAIRNFVAGCIEVVAATIGAHKAGLSGLCAGWLVVVCAEAAFMAPAVYHVARFASRPRDPAPTPPPQPVGIASAEVPTDVP